ncbi:MAG: hypothetical protein AAF614_41260, partial [Chloroflexota bacterium]
LSANMKSTLTPRFDIQDEDDLMQPALLAAAKAARLGNYFIGAALFRQSGELIATAYGAGVTAGEVFHAETQLAVLLRAGRAASIFGNDEPFIMTTTLQSCPQCRQICIQQKNLLVLYGAATKTSGAELGDLLETYTNTEKKRIAENGGQPVVRAARLSDEVRRQCVDGHQLYRNNVLKTVEDVVAPLMPFTDLLDFIESTDPTLIPRIRQYQAQERQRIQLLVQTDP